METKKVWCVKTHIASFYETTTDDVKLFNALEDAEKFFDEVADEGRRLAAENEWVIGFDDKHNFEAYEEGYYAHTHYYVSLFETKIE